MPTLVTSLRDLWRLRLAVIAILLAAMLVGLLVAFRFSFPLKLESRRYYVGTATVRVLVDTPISQVVEVAPKGSDTLAARADLLANLIVDGVVKDAIARRSGLRPADLGGISRPATSGTPADAAANPRRFVLTTSVLSSESGDQLPIIEIAAQAPDESAAAKLANSAVASLVDYLNSQAANTPDGRRLRVTGLGAAQAGTVVRGPGVAIALVVAVALFGLGCALLLLVRTVVRDWRAVSEEAPLMDKRPAVEEPASLSIVAEEAPVMNKRPAVEDPASLSIVAQPLPPSDSRAPGGWSGENWAGGLRPAPPPPPRAHGSSEARTAKRR